MEAEPGKTAWFAGAEFSAADVQMRFPLGAAGTAVEAGRPRRAGLNH